MNIPIIIVPIYTVCVSACVWCVHVHVYVKQCSLLVAAVFSLDKQVLSKSLLAISGM